MCSRLHGKSDILKLTGLSGLAVLAAIFPANAQFSGVHQAARDDSPVVARMLPAVLDPGVPHVRTSGPRATGAFACQAPQSRKNPVPCYGPMQMRAAYNVPNSLTGVGQTIVIVDAFQSPTIRADLNTFDAQFGLPPATLRILAPQGLTPFNAASPDDIGWSLEISLDVEYAHAIAPGAAIDLVLARSAQDPDILAAQQYAINQRLGSVLSQSFGEGERCMKPVVAAAQHLAFELAAGERMSVFASAGDTGSAQADCGTGSGYFLGTATPASDPLVTAVGGTHLNANLATGAYESESVWNDSGRQSEDFGAGGGGFSARFAQPSYQAGLPTSGARGVPDVSYSGDVSGGVLVTWSESGQGPGKFFVVGGTSEGAPQWAGIAALADEAAGHSLGALNPALYAIGASSLAGYAFHDITVGNNAWDQAGVPGYTATAGWDPASGLGTPNVAHLVQLLARPVMLQKLPRARRRH
jgi:subtilase family serine protease